MDIHIKRGLGLGSVVIIITAGAILLEVLLDAIGLERHKHLIGNIGAFFILLSFVYSIRKKKIIFKTGNILTWLKVHESLAIAGTLFILIHAGLHTHAAVPLISLALIFITFVSGLVGRYVHEEGRSQLKAMREELTAKGIAPAEIAEMLKPQVDANRRLLAWRAFHKPLVFTLFLFVFFHILSALYYGGF